MDHAEATAFEDHLARCEACGSELQSLTEARTALADFAADLPPERQRNVTPAPGAPLLDRLLGEVRAARRASRRRQLYLVAAALVLIVGGPVVTAAMSPGTGRPPAAAVVSATAPDGVHASVRMTDRSWGTDIGLTLSGLRGPLSCELVAVSRTGAAQTTSTWSVPGAGYGVPGNPVPFTVMGGTGFPRSQIDHFDVRTLDGHTLVTVKA